MITPALCLEPHLVSENNTSHGIGYFDEVVVTEASTLGLKPGEWPPTLPTSLGNGQPFVLTHADRGAVIYKQQLGVLFLRVRNT
jgi:hypothetical protein